MEFPEGFSAVANADDMDLVITGRCAPELEQKAYGPIEQAEKRMEEITTARAQEDPGFDVDRKNEDLPQVVEEGNRRSHQETR